MGQSMLLGKLFLYKTRIYENIPKLSFNLIQTEDRFQSALDNILQKSKEVSSSNARYVWTCDMNTGKVAFQTEIF